jgi:transcriptional regulator GlxA family with amidase domain
MEVAIMRIQIVLFDGFDPLDVLGPFEVFHIGAGLTGGGLTVELVSAEGPRLVPSGLEAVSLTATAALDPAADLVVVPGAVGVLALDPEVDGGIGQLLARAGSSALAGPLRDAVGREGTTVATVCGGSLLVAWAGLADGRPLVTHGHGADLAGTAARPVDARVVDDGDLVSAGNVTSGIDLALHLLEREVGPQVAHAVEQVIRHERRGTVWRATGVAVSGT